MKSRICISSLIQRFFVDEKFLLLVRTAILSLKYSKRVDRLFGKDEISDALRKETVDLPGRPAVSTAGMVPRSAVMG